LQKMTNETPVKGELFKMTNKNKEASNNNIQVNTQNQNIIEENNENIYDYKFFGYDKEEEEEKTSEKNGFFSGLISKIFGDNNIIKRKKFK